MSVTQLEVIRKFMKSLDDSKTLEDAGSGWKSAAKALDEAAAACSGGMFKTMQAVIDSYLSDLSKYGTSEGGSWYGASAAQKAFLSKYCGILLDNADTGAITGADAGGARVKDASGIVPEPMTAAVYPLSSQTTIRGLTFVWPTASEMQSDYIGDSATKRTIVADLNSWWAASALDLIKDSYGLSFSEAKTTVRSIKVKFYYSWENVLAHVGSSYSAYSGHTSALTLNINLRYYSSIAASDRDGKSPSSATYLDRTLAHELTHAAMAANITNFSNLPDWVTEGLAELVHGVDDERAVELSSFASKSYVSDWRKLFTYNQQQQYTYGTDTYAGGYLLFRYLAKKVSDASKKATPAKPTKPVQPAAKPTYGYTNGGLTVTLYANYKSASFAPNAKVATIDASRTTGTLALRGNAKNNTIVLGKGTDTVLYGRGYGSDTVRGFKSGRDKVRSEKGRVQSVTASGGNAYLRYGKGKNVLTLVGMQNKAFTLDGQRTIAMDQNHKTTLNYAANTVYYGSTRYQDTLRVYGGSVSLGDGRLKNIDVLDARASKKAVTLTGGKGSTTLYGSNYGDVLKGAAGNTSFVGGKGNDRIYGGSGVDTIFFGAGDGSDTVYSFQAGRDQVRTRSGRLQSATASGGNVYLRYSKGSNVLTLVGMQNKTFRLDGRNTVVMDQNHAATVNYAANTTYYGSTRFVSTLRVTSGRNVSASSWALKNIHALDAQASTRAVTLTSGYGTMTLYGSRFGDKLVGSTANTFFFAGKGNDQLYGGRGVDTIFFGRGDGQDTVRNLGSNDFLYFYHLTTADVYRRSVWIGGRRALRFQVRGSSDTLTVYPTSATQQIRVVLGDKVYSLSWKNRNLVYRGAYTGRAVPTAYRMPKGVTYSWNGQTAYLNAYMKGTFDASKNAALWTIDARSSTQAISIRGNARNNTIYLGKGTDTVYFGASSGNDTVYGFKAGRDQVRSDGGGLKGVNTSGSNVYLRYGKNALNLANMTGKAFYLDGKRTVVMDQHRSSTLDYAAGTTFYGHAGYVSTLRVKNTASVSLQDSRLKNIRALDARSSKRAVTLTGSNQLSTTLYGSRYSDRLYGGRGHTTFYAGAGNDQITCGAGKDTIYYTGRSGADIVRGFDAARDEIRGANPLSIRRSGNNVYLRYDNRGSMITLKNMKANSFRLNGRKVNVTVPTPPRAAGGSSDSRAAKKAVTLTGASSGSSYLYGSVYNDVLRGNGANTVIYGGRGNDTITCGRGKETIFFGWDDGMDTVYNIGAEDTVYLYDVITVNAELSANKKDLVLSLGYDREKGQHHITFKNWNGTQKFKVQQKDWGTVYQPVLQNGFVSLRSVDYTNTPNRSFLTNIGTSKNDTLRAASYGQRLEGREGDNVLYGGAGADVFDEIDFSEGMDTIWNYDPAKDTIATSTFDSVRALGNDVVFMGGWLNHSFKVKNAVGKTIHTVCYGYKEDYRVSSDGTVTHTYLDVAPTKTSAKVWYDKDAASAPRASALASVYDVQALNAKTSAAKTRATSHASVQAPLVSTAKLAAQPKEYQLSSYAALKKRS